MKREFSVKVQYSGKRKDGGGEHYHINIPTELAKAFALDNDTFLIVEPDIAMGFIKLIPAKIVPRASPAKVITE